MGNQTSQRLRGAPQPTKRADGASASDGRRNSKLWHLYGRSYDFTEYLEKHPGGREALMCARGLPDATALFESYHPTPPRKLLEQFSSKPSTVVIHTPHEYTFEEDGFYNRLRKRVKNEMVKAGYGPGFWKAGAGNIAFGLALLALQTLLRVALWFLPSLGVSPTNLSVVLAMAFVMGCARGLTITRMSHSSSHHAFCKNPRLNRLMYRVCMAFMGGSVEHWTNQHIVRHHIETNIIPVDYDTMYPLKRTISDYKPKPMHRQQHIYMWFLYPFIMVPWCIGDFAYALHPRVTLMEKLKTVTTSSLFVVYAWVLPFVCLPAPAAWAMWAVELVVSSTIFFSQFVVNHEVPGTEGHSTAQDWGVYQVRSSHDFGIVGGWAEWLTCHISGGLNNQIAHHLFPSVHFRFYPMITRIIRTMCEEEGIPFLESRTVLQALQKHHRHMREMGNPPSAALRNGSGQKFKGA